MAKVFLEKNETNVYESNNEVFGNTGMETLLIKGTGNTVHSSVERIEFAADLDSYTFAITGNVVTVKTGITTVATITVPDTAAGQTLAFADGSAALKITGLNQATLGGVAIPTAAAPVVAPLVESDPSTLVVPDSSNNFTLTEAIVDGVAAIPAVTEIYWGYNPHPHNEGSGTVTVDNTAGGNTNNLTNEGPLDGGVPVADMLSFLGSITGLDLFELGLINADGTNAFSNVTNLSLSNPLTSSQTGNANNSGDPTNPTGVAQDSVLTISYADGTSLNVEAHLGTEYFAFLNNLLFDAEGNSRLFEKVITPAIGATADKLQPIKLTPEVNNGGTIETGFTNDGDDIIVAGRVELLHQAYIDAGDGYNILEIDAKGTYAQPAALFNIQEVRVNDLPNFYTTTYGAVNGYGNLDNTLFTGQYPTFDADNNLMQLGDSFLSPTGTFSDDTWIDLNRATSIEKLVVTDQGNGSGTTDSDYSGNLTIVGVRNAATLRLEGGFNSGATTIQYGQGQTGTLDVELAIGDVTKDINILQNAAVLNVDSTGVVNHMHSFFAGGSVSRMIVKGTGEFAIDENIAPSFNHNAAVIIDATANTGGLNINFDGSGHDVNAGVVASTPDRFASVTVKGSAVNNDTIMVKNVSAYTPDQIASNNGATTLTNGKVTIDAGNGDNSVVTDGSAIVKVTTGTGDDTIFTKSAQITTIIAGDGANVINADGSVIATITSGAGDDNISVQGTAAVVGVAANGSTPAVLAVDGFAPTTVTINAGDGNNRINTDLSKTVSITSGIGNDNISSIGSETVVIDAAAGNNTIMTTATVSANITTGAGNDTITAVGKDITINSAGGTDKINLSGTYTGEGLASAANGAYGSDNLATGNASDGALLTIRTGTAATDSATITFGNDQSALTPAWSTELKGVTALDGSVIAGNNVKLYIDSPTNLVWADMTGLTGTTKVVVEQGDKLRISSDQFKMLGAAAFSERLAGAGAQTGDIFIVVPTGTKAFDLSAMDLTALSPNIKLHFELQEATTLTLTAQQLNDYLANDAVTSVSGTNGAAAASPNGYVIINNAGPTFKINDDEDLHRVFGTIDPAKVDATKVNQVETGFNRATDVTNTDVIDSTAGAVKISKSIVSDLPVTNTLKIIGTNDVTFAAGTSVTLNATSGDNKSMIDFSGLTGKLNNMTVKAFDTIASVSGNNTGTRINIELKDDLGTSSATGLNTKGVAQYVVTAIDTDNDSADMAHQTQTLWLCDKTQDVTVIGLQGNAGKTLTVKDVPWGGVHPTFLLEGDGYANATDGPLKSQGSPDSANIGTLNVEFFTPGAPAEVEINNGPAHVALGTTRTDTERGFLVDGINVTNAKSLTIKVADGDAVITDINGGSDLKTLTLTASEDVNVTSALPTSLETISAAGVAGKFTGTIAAVAAAGVEAKFTFTGSNAGNSLTLDGITGDSFDAVSGTVIKGGTLGADLTIKGIVTLDNATLTDVNTATLSNGSTLKLTIDQVNAIGASDIKISSGDTATLNLVGLNSDPFAVANFATGISVGVTTVAALPVVTLAATTDLSKIGSLTVLAGTTLNLTAHQFQELDNAGTITVQKGGKVNITDLTAADIKGGFSLAGITAVTADPITGLFTVAGTATETNAVRGTLTLASDVTLAATDSITGFDVVMKDGQTLGLGSILQANGLKISGGTNTVLQIVDATNFNTTLAADLDGVGPLVAGQIDASGLNVSKIKLLNVAVDGENIDKVLDHLPGAVIKEIYNDLGWVGKVNQIVTVVEGTSVLGALIFNPLTDDTELQTFTLNLSGGTEIVGNLDLSTFAKGGATSNTLRTYLETVTINSTGTSANLLTTDKANVINGDLTAAGLLSASDMENNLKSVVINATQDLKINGIHFSSVNDGIAATTADSTAVATVEVKAGSTAAVTLGVLDTSDTDVDTLNVINNGTGKLTATLDNTTQNSDVLSFTGTGSIDLKVATASSVDLSGDTLTAVKSILIDGNGDLTLTFGQYAALTSANILADADLATTATLNIVGLDGSAAFIASATAGISIASVTVAAGNVTLNPLTDLTGVTAIKVPEGSTLSLTAAQYQQLKGIGSIIAIDGPDAGTTVGSINVNITDLKQSDVTRDSDIDGDVNNDNDTKDATDTLDLTGIVVGTGGKITVSLSDAAVTLGTIDATGATTSEVKLNGAEVTLAAGQTLSLVNAAQANALKVAGAADSTLIFKFANFNYADGSPTGFTQINAVGYNVTTLKALATFVGGTDVEQLLLNVPSAVVERYYADALDLGFVPITTRIAVVEKNVTVPGSYLMYNDLQDTKEVRSLDFSLEGGSTVNGDLDLSTTLKPVGAPNPVQRYLDALTIHSKGDATNTIAGDITAVDPDLVAGAKIENNLLNVTIDATQKLVIGAYDATTGAYAGTGGDIIFTSVTDAASAVLNITGTAAVTVHGLDVADNTNNTITSTGANEPDISTLTITNSSTGLFTATGGTAAITGLIENLVLKGTGAMAFGTNAPGGVVNAEGVTSSTLSSIDASGMSGALSLGKVTEVDKAAFAFKAGSGLTTMTLKDAVLSGLGADKTLDVAGVVDPTGANTDTAGWSFDFSSAAVGSEFHLDAPYASFGAGMDVGTMNIKLGNNTTLYIDQTMDLTKMNLSITQVKDIILADGATLTLTAAQANTLKIVAGAESTTDGDALFTGKVNITELGTAAVDLSNIAAGIAGDITLAANDVTLADTTNLGPKDGFRLVLNELNGSSAGATGLAGQTIRFKTVAQAERDIIVTEVITNNDDSSANVIWLFDTIPGTNPLDTAGYDPAIGRLWFTSTLVTNEGGLVENLFTTLPSSILRVDFATLTELNVLLSSTPFDRTLEVTSFKVLGDLTFSDIGVNPEEHIRSLDIQMGGQVTIGDITINDVSTNVPPATMAFNQLTLTSMWAGVSAPVGFDYAAAPDITNPTARHYLASQTIDGAPYVNDGDGVVEWVNAARTKAENTQPILSNTVGNIGVGATASAVGGTSAYMDLTLVNIRATEAALNTGTITFDRQAAGIVTLDVEGANNVNITSVNTTDADITALTVDTTGFSGVLTAPGNTPALQMNNTETLTFQNGGINHDNGATVGVFEGSLTFGSATHAGLASTTLSVVSASAFGDMLNLGVVSQLDSTNDDDLNIAGVDTLKDAFNFVSGTGINTMTLAASETLTPTLNAGSEWDFTYTQADPGSYLKLTSSVVLTGGSTLRLTDVPLQIEGAVNLSQLVDDPAVAGTQGLIVQFDAAGTRTKIEVLAGATLTLTAGQVDYLNSQSVDIVGAGMLIVTGDASNLTLGANIKTVGVNIAAVTLIASPTTGFDIDATVALTGLTGADHDNNVATALVAQTIVGSGNADAITTTSTGNDTINGGAGNDVLDGGAGNDTYNVDAGTDTITSLVTGDILVVSVGATANANVPDDFVATAATINNGIAVLTDNTDGDASVVAPLLTSTIDVHLATGNNGFSLIGSTLTAGVSPDTDLDVLIGGSKVDILNGGNTNQSAVGMVDTLTGNGGADVFQFNVGTSTPVSPAVTLTTAGHDREIITVTGATAAGTSIIDINYTLNGVIAATPLHVNVTAGELQAVTAFNIAAAFGALTGFTASSGGTNVATVEGPNGSSLTIDSIIEADADLIFTPGDGTDVAQVSRVTFAASPPAIVAGEKFIAHVTLAGGATETLYTTTATSPAIMDQATLATDLAATIDFSSDLAAGTSVVGALSGVNITDSDADNGGFTLTANATGGFSGSGASNINAANVLTADKITDFLSGTDFIKLGLVAGSGTTYAEGLVAGVADYAAALVAANAAMPGLVQYYMTSVLDVDSVTGGAQPMGLLFFDANNDDTIDGVIQLVGLTSANFAAADIIV